MEYTLSLYEMVQKRVNLSFKTSEDFTVEDFRQKLGVEKDKYPIYRVLKPAVLEVNRLSDIECSIEPILEGRKTTGLRLTWRKKTTDETVKNVQAPPKQGTGKASRTGGPALRVVGDATETDEPLKPSKRLRELNTRECEQLKKTFFSPAAAFTNWLKQYYKITGPLLR